MSTIKEENKLFETKLKTYNKGNPIKEKKIYMINRQQKHWQDSDRLLGNKAQPQANSEQCCWEQKAD